MALSKVCNVEGGNTASAVRSILTQLLEKGLVGAVMVPLEVPSKNSVVQAVVRTAAEMKYANPIAPVMPVNSAKIVSRLTRQGPGSEKIAIVVRPCEERALVELEKLKQADTENLVVIGIDCHGTYTVTDYAAQSLDQADVTARYLGQVCSGDDPL
ncbi:MAG: formate dehydrogenase, partial [Deltaproteobacteria bacterium]|nr:formate dehydrogenase [Deltaproteobacteria bacterium]